MSEIKRHLLEAWEGWFGSWLNLRKLAADARAIKFDPGAAVTGDLLLHNTPFAFASQALLLPTVFFLATVSLAGVIFPIPSPIENEVTEDRNELPSVIARRNRALTKLQIAMLGLPPRLRELELRDLERRQAKALTERARLMESPSMPATQKRLNAVDAELRLLQKAIVMHELAVDFVKIASYENSVRDRIAFGQAFVSLQKFAVASVVPFTSAILLMNAVTFTWLIKRSRAPFDNVDIASRSYLYLIGEANLVPNLLVGFLVVQMDLTFRFHADAKHIFIIFGTLLWLAFGVQLYAIKRIVARARIMAVVLQPWPDTSPRAAFWHLLIRLIGAHLLTSSVANVLMIAAGIGLYKFNSFWQWVTPW